MSDRVAPPSEKLLIGYTEAAALLDITPVALRSRVMRGAVPSYVIKRTGRRVQFFRPRLVEWLERETTVPRVRKRP